MPNSPADLAARQAIAELLAAYADAVWRHDYDAFAHCFAEDGEWRISGLELRGREAIRATIAQIMARLRKVRISFATPILSIGETTASGRVLMSEQCAWHNGETNLALGTYYDRFCLTAQGWRFAWRLFAQEYRGPPDLSGRWFAVPDYGAPPAMPPRDAATPDVATRRWGLGES